jgi:trimeric autotransporter adhesin
LAGGEYLLGAVAGSSSSTSKNGSYQSSSTTTNSYVWRDGPLQSQIAYAQSGQPTYNTYFTYDAQGALKSASINDGRPRTVTYKTNVEGQAIRRDESDNNYNQGDPHEVWYRFAGRQWGYVGNNGSLSALSTSDSIASRTYAPGTGAFRHGATYGASHTDFALTPEGINSYAQGSAAGSYTVQRTGDTLSGIAQALWGDESLWFKLAQANGLAADTTLVEGQRLTVPAGVIRSAHNANTLRPYRRSLKPAVQLRNSARSMILVSVKPRYCPGHMNSILRIATEILYLRLHSPPVRACGPSSQS